MKTIEILKNLLTESGIRIPKEAKAVKLIHHEDLDGVFSAILTYRQLIKQGINSNNIYIDGIQYGDNKSAVEKQLAAKKGQMIALVDFARIPESARRPDFWSDHHEAPEGVKKSIKGAAIGKTEFASDAEHLATSHTQGLADSTTTKAISMVDSAKYKKLEDAN